MLLIFLKFVNIYYTECWEFSTVLHECTDPNIYVEVEIEALSNVNERNQLCDNPITWYSIEIYKWYKREGKNKLKPFIS